MLCDYGCEKEASNQFKNGKWCCSKNWNMCINVKRLKEPIQIYSVELCDYGCGVIAKFQFKNGKICCNKNIGGCKTTVDKSVKFHTGRKRPKNTGLKIREKKLGKVPWNKGVEPYNKNISLIEMYGKEKAKEIKEKRSKTVSKTMIEKGVKPFVNYKYLQGYFYSEKNGCELYYASSYELAFYRLLEKDMYTISYKKPNFSIEYARKDGVIHNYHPDVLVYDIVNGTMLYEIKPSYQLEDEINILKWEAAKKFCDQQNIFFIVLTEKNLKSYIKSIHKEFNLK